jgi:hypothetical protein
VFENRVLRRIFRPKRDEVTGEWRKLHNEELRDLYVYSSPRIISDEAEEDEMGGACSTNEGEKECIWMGKPAGKRPLGRPRYSWVLNIRMDLGEVGCSGMDWIGLVQDRG